MLKLRNEGSSFEIFGFEDDPDQLLLLFICIVISTLTLVRILYEGTRAKMYVPESALLVVMGIIIGAIIAISTSTQSEKLEDYFTFPPNVFLYIFVPVIIFDATYFLNKRAFFGNFLEISTYAVAGTLFSTLAVGGLYLLSRPALRTSFDASELLTFSALISAVDPVAVIAVMEQMHVNETLFNLVFGESTLNDGVAIVLFNLFRGVGALQDAGRSGWAIAGLGVAKFLVSVLGAVALAAAVTAVFCLVSRVSYRLPGV